MILLIICLFLLGYPGNNNYRFNGQSVPMGPELPNFLGRPVPGGAVLTISPEARRSAYNRQFRPAKIRPRGSGGIFRRLSALFGLGGEDIGANIPQN